MKLTRNKKILLLVVLIAFVFLMSGCTVPTVTDPATGEKTTKYIYITTTFSEIFNSENFFNALLVWPICQLINWLSPKIGVAFGIAIATFLVNLITLAVTIKSTVQSQQMQMIQPEMNKITKKYEGKTDEASKMRQAQEMQSLYKKYNINPFGAILTTFIQFPIIIAMYQAVQRSSEVATGSFLGMKLEISPLTGFQNGQYGYIFLFVVMGLLQYFSMMLPQILAKQRAKKEAEIHHRKPEDVKQPGGNMMLYMMVFILIVSVGWPAAMTIYWAISSLVNILKTLFIQKFFVNKQANEVKA